MFATLEHVLRSFDERKFQDIVVRARSDLCPVDNEMDPCTRFTSEALQSLSHLPVSDGVLLFGHVVRRPALCHQS